MRRAVLVLVLLAFVACGGNDGNEGVGVDIPHASGDASAADVSTRPQDVQASTDSVAVPDDVSAPALENRLSHPEFVIVAPDNFVAAYEPLAEWRNARGTSTRVVSLSDVGAEFAGRDLQERIRAAISSWRDEGVGYVLLGADHPMLPRREVHCDAYNAPEDAELDEYVAAEMYYADLDGDWDADGDGKWGELEDELDLFPDIAIGRVPARDIVEVGNFIAKVRAYEDPSSPAYLGRAALLGEYAGSVGYVSVCSTILLETFRDLFPDSIDLTRYYADECGSYEGAVSNTTSAQRNMWNDGVGLVLDLGHGDWYTMGLLTSHSIRELSNGARPGVYLTCECHGCEFDHEDADHSACEEFVISPGGGVTYIGNTDFGVGVPWESAYYRELIEYLYSNPGTRAGDLFNHAISTYAEGQWDGFDSYPFDLRWTQFTLVLMGDPSMVLWTGEPASPRVTVSEQGALLEVDVEGEEARVALYGADRFLYTQQTDAQGRAQFAVPESPYQITVTGPGILPWTKIR